MSNFLVNVSRWLEQQARIRNTVRELSALTDKDLSDIGIARCDIYAVARGDITRYHRLV